MERLLEIALTNAGSAAVMAIGIAALESWIRRPSVIRGLWMLVLIKLLMPPVLELGIPIRQLPALGAVELNPSLAQPSAPATVTIDGESVGPTLSFETTALWLWIAGALAMVGLTLVRTMRCRRLLNRAVAAPEAFRIRVAALAAKMGIARPPRAVVIDARISPMLWAAPGAFQLIVPAVLIDRLSAAELDTLVAHELAHLRRRDHWVRGLELIAQVVFWWHPVVWWACRRLRRAEEQCCDAQVFQTLPGQHRAYADCLLKTMKFLAHARYAEHALASGLGEVRDLHRRLTMIMTRRLPPTLSLTSRAVLTMAALGLLAVFPTATVAENDPSTAADPPDIVEPLDFDETSDRGEPIDLQATGVPLEQLLRRMAESTGLNLVMEPGVDLSVPVTVAFEQMPWGQVLATLLEDNGFGYAVEGNMVWIFAPATAQVAANDFVGAPISVIFDKVDLRRAFEALSTAASLELELAPNIEGTLTLHLRDVPWDQALDTILRLHRLEYTVEGRVLKIHPAK